MFRSKRIRISLSEAQYDLLIGLAKRHGYPISVEAYFLFSRAMQDQVEKWRQFDEAARPKLDTRGDLRRDIEQAALGYPGTPADVSPHPPEVIRSCAACGRPFYVAAAEDKCPRCSGADDLD